MSKTDSEATLDIELQNGLESLEGKYLTFFLDNEEYGIEILKVQEIIRMQSITSIPRTPPFIRGVINLRGKVIPVMELRTRFDLPHHDDDEKTCIVVVRIKREDGELATGIIIDEVKEVVDIAAEYIEQTPSFGASIDTGFIMGIGKTGDTVRMLLDIDKVLSGKELDTLQNLPTTI